MSQGRPLTFWTPLIALVFLPAIPLLHADDKPNVPDGYTAVKVKMGGKNGYVLVKKELDPLQGVSSSDTPGKYDPERIFSTASALSNKQFSTASLSVSENTSAIEEREQRAFVTKPYAGDGASLTDQTTPNLGSKVFTPTAGAYNVNASGFDKTYQSNSDVGQNRTAVLASSETSPYQNRSAVLGGPDKAEGLGTDSMAHQQYIGPGAQHVPAGITIKENIVLSRMSSLPNRPLSIDEVRNLINHDTKPDTDVKPDEPSKPLNDPNYKPEPLRDNPSPGSDEDKNDPVPSPGTMAAPQPPENTESLPQP